MNILLINENPVVSRLLALCTRPENLVLHEVTEASDVADNDYDIIFVDSSSYKHDILELLSKFPKSKKIFISYNNDHMQSFHDTIKKPFLPSQITDIINNVFPVHNQSLSQKEALNTYSKGAEDIRHTLEESEKDTIFPLTTEEKAPSTHVLDEDEIEKIKALLDTDEEISHHDETLNKEELETRKIELIKEQLIADGLEIVDEAEIVEELSISLDGTLHKVEAKQTKSGKKNKVKKKKSKKIKFTEKNMQRIEDAVEIAIATMTKKQMKKLLKGKKIEISVKLQEGN